VVEAICELQMRRNIHKICCVTMKQIAVGVEKINKSRDKMIWDNNPLLFLYPLNSVRWSEHPFWATLSARLPEPVVVLVKLGLIAAQAQA